MLTGFADGCNNAVEIWTTYKVFALDGRNNKLTKAEHL